jgi:hypothetical protein
MHRNRVLALAGALVLGGGITTYLATRNSEPIATPDTVAVESGSAAVIAVIDNDRDPDGDRLTVTGVSEPRRGTVRISPDARTVEYRPEPSYFGEDTFHYTIEDGRGGRATARVAVSIRLQPPEFLRRRGSASLSEMLQQPPTSIFGSSINVFAFEDESGVAEISIAGHADSRTCSAASGIVANTLLDKGAAGREFLLAGAGRLARSTPVDPAAADHPDVRAWQSLADARRLFAINRLPVPVQILQRLAEAERNPVVRAYRESQVASDMMRDSLKLLSDLSAESGLVRVHRLPASIPGQVRSRISEAVTASVPTVLRFDDLLPATTGQGEQAEALVFVPLIDSRSGADVVLDIAVGEFSADGFAQAVQEQRDAVEVAMVGNARARIRLATERLSDTRRTLARCRAMSQAELGREIVLDWTCTPDGCFRSSTPVRTTWREYCSTRLPRNEAGYSQWVDDAEALLKRIEAQRSTSGGVVDRITHAAVVDSMLRNWALPVRGQQAAFDHWRTQRRGRAWEAVTNALDTLGIDRRILSGENVVLPVTVEGNRLRITPMLAVDLRRSVLVVDSRLGGIAILDAWGEREVVPVNDSASPGPPPTRDASQLLASLQALPSINLTAIVGAWSSELPAHPDDTASRESRGAALLEARRWEEIGSFVDTFEPQNIQHWRERGVGFVNVLLGMPEVTLETLLRGALKLAEGISSFEQNAADPWALLRQPERIRPTASPPDSPLRQALGDAEPRRVLALLLQRARRDDPELLRVALDQGRLPEPPSPREARMREAIGARHSVLDFDVGFAREARRALVRRADVLEALELVYLGASLERVSRQLSSAVSSDGTNEFEGGQLERLSERLRERVAMPLTEHAIFRAELAGELRAIANRLLAQARSARDSLPIRFGAQRELLVARIAYEEGQYSSALGRALPETLPVSLYHPALRWDFIGSEVGAFGALRARSDGASLIIAAQKEQGWRDVLRLHLPPGPDRDALAAEIAAVSPAANSDELIAERILTIELPIRPTLAETFVAVRDPAVRLAMLKTLAYGCGIPAPTLVPLPGSCRERMQPRAGVTEGVRDGAERFRVTELEELARRAALRFASADPGAAAGPRGDTQNGRRL